MVAETLGVIAIILILVRFALDTYDAILENIYSIHYTYLITMCIFLLLFIVGTFASIWYLIYIIWIR
jgi:hypothetical protein